MFRKPLLALMIAASTGAAQAAEPRYPASLDRAALTDWLSHETDITPGQVLAVSPAAVTALVSTMPAYGAGAMRASIRGEALRTEGGPKPGVISWQTAIEADCRAKRIKVGATTGYTDRNLLGQPLAVSPGDNDWRAPPAGTQLENVWKALCQADFARPLAGGGAVAVSASEAAPSEPEPPAVEAKVAPPAPVRTPTPATPVANVAVQVVASPNGAEAIGLAVRLRDRFPLPGRELSTRIGEVQVQGRTFYRGLVSGFSSREEAIAWCDRLKAAGQACLIR